MVRVGAIRYLNALPLVAGLEAEPGFEVEYRVPSLLAEGLRRGEFDVALVPQVEASRADDYRIIPGPCISCLGAVRSILLFRRAPWRDIKRVAVDLSSNSSVALLSVLFYLETRRVPELIRVPPRLDPLEQPSQNHLDAMLLIGDPALAANPAHFEVDDLGSLWYRAVGLPFVFAVWLTREGFPQADAERLQQAWRRNLQQRESLARNLVREYPGVLDFPDAYRYLTESIRYSLGAREIESLERFAALRRLAGLDAPASWRPQFLV